MRRPRRFNAGGWAPPGRFKMQRTDQGQDFELPLGHHLVAPGDGVVLSHQADRAFPNGFGDPYAIVRIFSGRFAHRDWYLGHANADVPKVGHKFKRGERLCKLNNSLNSGWGWVEIGVWDGGPGPMGTGEKYHHLFRPVWRFA